MSERWVMTERKLITVTEALADKYATPNTRQTSRIYAVGEDAPPEHWGRPYTRKVEDEPAERSEDPSPNRMLDTSGAKKRGRPRKDQP